LDGLKQASFVAWLRPAAAMATRATARREAYHPQARCQRFNRVHGVVTPRENPVEAK